jgi:hypothetical protein
MDKKRQWLKKQME